MIIKNNKQVSKIFKGNKLIVKVFKGDKCVFNMQSETPYLNVSKETLWLNPSTDFFDVISNVKKWNII